MSPEDYWNVKMSQYITRFTTFRKMITQATGITDEEAIQEHWNQQLGLQPLHWQRCYCGPTHMSNRVSPGITAFTGGEVSELRLESNVQPTSLNYQVYNLA